MVLNQDREQFGMAVMVAVIIFASVVLSWMYFSGFRQGWLWSLSWTWQWKRFGLLWSFDTGFLSIWLSFVLTSICSAFRRILNICSNMTPSPDSDEDVGMEPRMPLDVVCRNLNSSRTGGPTPSLDESNLQELMRRINDCNSQAPWQMMMEKSTPTLDYQAWYRDPPFGPTHYRTRTIFQNVVPELVRDFFWDDEFRTKWDKMLVYFETLQVCPETGAMVVHWIRKLPLIFREREYVIVRRIWESGPNYYCVTKGTSYPSFPRGRTCKRVDLYYSSWSIKPAKSRNEQQATASEVLFFHYEDIGIPKEIIKMGARASMWTLVKRMDTAVQAYNLKRANGASLSAYALLARITTEFEPSPDIDPHLEISYTDEEQEKRMVRNRRGPLRWLVVGGIIVATGLTVKYNGKGLLSEVAKCLQDFWNQRKQQESRNKKERIRLSVSLPLGSS